MTVPDLLEQTLLRLLHALDHLLARYAAGEIVGVGQQAAFARDFFDVSGQHIVVQQAGDDLLGGQALRNGELMRHHAAFDDGRDHVAHAGVRLELIFAGLEILTRLEREHAANKHPRLIDDAVAHQHIGNVADAGAARNIDNAVLRQRPGSIEPLLADHKRHGGYDRRQDEETDDGVADDDKRMPRSLGAACRHLDSIRLQRGSRAARREVFRIF